MNKPKKDREYLRLRKVKPEEWRERVLRVAKKARTEVAHIIWWDHFSQRNCTERLPHMDDFLRKPVWNKPSDKQIIAGLMACGYSEGKATRRIGSKT